MLLPISISEKKRSVAVFIFSSAVLFLLCTAALLFGRYPSPGFMTLSQIREDPMAMRIILMVRLPRIVGAIFTGAMLGVAGCVFQLLFANPLVDAGFLGVSQGSSFGAALAFSLGLGSVGLFGLSFGFSLLALAMAVFLSSRIHFGGAVLRLILAGIAVSAFFSASVALVKYTADPLRELPDIMYWMMGGLSGISWQTLAVVAPASLLCISALVAVRWRVSLLALDEATARSLGAKPKVERTVMLTIATAGVAVVTAATGTVSWVGLIVPHLARLTLGTDASKTIPASALFGAIFVVLCDTVSRGLFPGEIPLGISTALIGTSLFIGLLLSKKMRTERG